jgi:rsbT co-antagonist protein RsbR
VASLTELSTVIDKRELEIVSRWLEFQFAGARRMSKPEQKEADRQSREFLGSLQAALQRGGTEDIGGSEWMTVREFLTDFSAVRAKNGYSPSETASMIFSLKESLFFALQEEYAADAGALGNAVWTLSKLLDNLGLFTMEAFQKSREEIISRQQQELLELSTPVVRLWDNILALPLIGTLDSARTQVVMENPLEAIVETRSDFAIIDITGVPVVDTLVAQHLLKTVAAARLMGADCLISGIRPQIAQTIIHLGVDLTGVTTKATLADAFALALRRSGNLVVREDKTKPTVR